MRLFVSIDLPDHLTEVITHLQADLADADGLSPTDPTQAHLTLKFLGNVDPERLPALETALTAAVDDADISPFSATFGGLGVFPNREYIRVLWLGVLDGSERFRQLHDAVETQTTAIGFEPADHDFTPHVTIGRVEHAGGKESIQEAVRTHDSAVGEMTVSEIQLTESTLTDSGPTYETHRRFPLALDDSDSGSGP